MQAVVTALKLFDLAKTAWVALQPGDGLTDASLAWDVARAEARVRSLFACEQADGGCAGTVAYGMEEATPCACRRYRRALSSLLESSVLAVPLPRWREGRFSGASAPRLAWRPTGAESVGDASVVDAMLFFLQKSAVKLYDLSDGCDGRLLQALGPQAESWKMLESLLALQAIFCSRKVGFASWTGLRRLGGGIFAKGFSIDIIDQMLMNHENIFLDLGSESFHPVAGGGEQARDTAFFELFIEAIARLDRGLIVCSSQRLFVAKTSSQEAVGGRGWRPDYRNPHAPRPSYRDAQNRLRFESVRKSQRPALSLEEVLHPSTFDKLLVALARGQTFLDS